MDIWMRATRLVFPFLRALLFMVLSSLSGFAGRRMLRAGARGFICGRLMFGGERDRPTVFDFLAEIAFLPVNFLLL
jgi:hypothetical protein